MEPHHRVYMTYFDVDALPCLECRTCNKEIIKIKGMSEGDWGRLLMQFLGKHPCERIEKEDPLESD